MAENQLNTNELVQWSHGKSDLISLLLIESFLLLKSTTAEGLDRETTKRSYNKIFMNISEYFSVHGSKSIRLSSSEEGSALLGAYFRSHLKINGEPIVILTPEQLKAVYTFIQPLVPEGSTSQQFLDSFGGSPAENHKEVLLEIIFNGINEEQKAGLFKDKYKNDIDTMLQAMLNIVEFIRTPFRVLHDEETAEKESATRESKEAKTSGIDLQWSTMKNAFKEARDSLLKKKTKDSEVAKEIQISLNTMIQYAEGGFGVENERYKNERETKKREQVTQQIFKILGFNAENPQEAFQTITEYVQETRNSLITDNPTETEAINAMSLVDLINKYDSSWRATLEESRTENSRLNDELQAERTKMLEKNQQLTRQLSEVQNQNEILQGQVTTANEQSSQTQELQAQIATLQNENQQLQESLSQKTSEQESKQHEQPSVQPSVPAVALQESGPDLSIKKTHLGFAVGALQLSNPESLLEKITASQNEESLAEVEKTINSLKRINQLVTDINHGILSRSGFFSSAPHKKTKAIEKAFNNLSVEEKISLITLTDDTIKEQTQSDDNVGKFLQEVKRNRGFISIKEATSFKFFKEHIKEEQESPNLSAGLDL